MPCFFPSRTLRRPVRTGLLHTRLVPTQCPEKNMTTWKTVYVYLQTRWSSDVICYQSVSCVSSVTGSKCCAPWMSHCHAHHCPARLLGPERTVAPVDFKTDPAGRFRSMAPYSIQHYRFLAQLNVIICHLLIVLKVTRGMGFTNCFPTCDSVLLGQAALQAVLMVDVLPNFRLAARFFTGAGLRRPHCCRWLV